MSKEDISLKFPNEQGKLRIYFHVSENSGVGYYRQYLPAYYLRKKHLANVMISDFRWGEGDHVEPPLDMLFPIANWADVIVVGRKDIPEFQAQWGGIREFFNVPIVLDTDDNVQFVRPYNPGYEGYHPDAEAQTWSKYGLAKVFDGITVSTENLKQFYSRYNPKIYVLPNNIDTRWFDDPTPPKKDDIVRIGFIGSAGHLESVNIIKKPVLDILKKYSRSKFYINAMFFDLFKEVPSHQVESVPWIKLEEWPQGLKNLNLDIGLAPLADNMFNRGKSNLRWMELSASRIPSIVSPVAPYLCVKNNEDGIFAKESSDWFKAIENMILYRKLREKIAENAHQRIRDEFNIEKNIPLWYNTYAEIVERYVSFYGKKRQFIKAGTRKYKEIRA